MFYLILIGVALIFYQEQAALAETALATMPPATTETLPITTTVPTTTFQTTLPQTQTNAPTTTATARITTTDQPATIIPPTATTELPTTLTTEPLIAITTPAKTNLPIPMISEPNTKTITTAPTTTVATSQNSNITKPPTATTTLITTAPPSTTTTEPLTKTSASPATTNTTAPTTTTEIPTTTTEPQTTITASTTTVPPATTTSEPPTTTMTMPIPPTELPTTTLPIITITIPITTVPSPTTTTTTFPSTTTIIPPTATATTESPYTIMAMPTIKSTELPITTTAEPPNTIMIMPTTTTTELSSTTTESPTATATTEPPTTTMAMPTSTTSTELPTTTTEPPNTIMIMTTTTTELPTTMTTEPPTTIMVMPTTTITELSSTTTERTTSTAEAPTAITAPPARTTTPVSSIATAPTMTTATTASITTEATSARTLISDLRIISVAMTSVNLSWSAPFGNVWVYIVEATGPVQSPNGPTVTKLTVNTSTEISGLVPGSNYTLRVIAVAADNVTEGASGNTSVFTNPDVVANLTVSNTTTTSLALTWSAPFGNAGGYRVEAIEPTGVITTLNVSAIKISISHISSESSGDGELYTENDTDLTVTFLQVKSLSINITGLVPGRNYTLQVIAVAADNVTEGAPVTISAFTNPNSVNNLTVMNISTTSLALTWSAPFGNAGGYRVEAIEPTGVITTLNVSAIKISISHISSESSGDGELYTENDTDLTVTFLQVKSLSINITGLVPGRNYTLQVIAVAADNVTEGAPVTISAFTNPNSVNNLTVMNISTTSLALTWSAPSGNAWGYRVEAIGPTVTNLTVNTLSAEITGLVPGSNYTLRVIAVAADNVTEGAPVTVTVLLAATATPTPTPTPTQTPSPTQAPTGPPTLATPQNTMAPILAPTSATPNPTQGVPVTARLEVSLVSNSAIHGNTVFLIEQQIISIVQTFTQTNITVKWKATRTNQT
ncbi:mucin-2-like [Amia ocellicauda]|uniref:mucin-2-like n=1 Tax=Amia ocellicauda TaxID=2972642 RepID=UPI0034641C72